MDSKDPSEKITITFPYSKELDGATIKPETVIVTVALLSGADPNPNLVLNGNPQIAGGAEVLQAMRDGVAGATYRFRSQADLTDGRRLIRTIDVAVAIATP